MDELFGKAILAWLALGAVVAALAMAAMAALIIFPGLIGFVGFLMVKSKAPLLNPNGPVLVPIIYAALWGCVISVGLFAGTTVLHPSLVKGPVEEAVAMKFFYGAMYDGFFLAVELTAILLSTLAFATSEAGRRNTILASALSCLTAALLLAASPANASGMDLPLVERVGRNIMDGVLFPLTVIDALRGGLNHCVELVRAWFLASEGNLYVIAGGLSKVLWLVAMIQGARYLFGQGRTSALPPTDSSLEAVDWGKLLVAIGGAGALAYLFSVVSAWQHQDHFFKWAFMALAAYLVVVWALWRVRPVVPSAREGYA